MARKSRKAIKHLLQEEERQYDALQEIEPATNEYGLAYAQWEHSLKNLKDVDDTHEDHKIKWWHILGFGLVTLATPLVGEGVMRISQSPYTRDVINKVTMGNHMPKPNLKDQPPKKG